MIQQGKAHFAALCFRKLLVGHINYIHRGPVDEPKDAPPTRTLNSMSAGLMEEKELLRVKYEYHKMHKPKPTPRSTKEKSEGGKPRLQV